MGVLWKEPDTKAEPEENGDGDAALAARAAGGDTDAFEILVGRYEKLVYHAAFRVTGHAEAAADLSQEIFLRIWRGLPTYGGRARFLTWLTRVTKNVCTDWIRSRKNLPPADSLTPPHDDDGGTHHVPEPAAPAADADPEEIFSRSERGRLLREALEHLSEEHRTVVRLRDVEGMSYERIADALGVDTGTVKSRLSRARAKLKEYLLTHGFY